MSLSLTIITPVLLLFAQWAFFDQTIFQHLLNYRLLELLKNTVFLVFGTTIFSLILGTILAYWVVFYRFKGRNFFQWALVLPLVFPGYVFAFIFLGFFDFNGPVQYFWNHWFSGLEFPDMRSSLSIMIVLTLTLYPYVYLIARSAFLNINDSVIHTAQMAGFGPLALFFRVILPMTWPSLFTACFLVMMEVLSDFGSVAIFNYDTLTTAIYQVWFSMFNFSSAAQLSSILLLFAFLLLLGSKILRGRIERYQINSGLLSLHFQLSPLAKSVCLLICTMTLLLGFILPLFQLMIWLFSNSQVYSFNYWPVLLKTVYLSVLAGFLVVFLALWMAYFKRTNQNRFVSTLIYSTTFGYALPGTVLSIGIMLFLLAIQHFLAIVWSTFFNQTFDFLLSQSIFGLLTAYTIRVMSPAFYTVDSGMSQIKFSIEQQAYVLGANTSRILHQIFYPIIKPSILMAFLIVFIDIIRELPITLLLHPFGWETLSIYVFNFASEAHWEAAALPGFLIVLTGFILVISLFRFGSVLQKK